MTNWNINDVRREFIKEFGDKFPHLAYIDFRVLNREEGEQVCKVLHKFGFIWEYGLGLLENKDLCYDPCYGSYNNAYYICVPKEVMFGSRPNMIQRERGLFVDTKREYDEKICIEFEDAMKGFVNIRKRMRGDKVAESK